MMKLLEKLKAEDFPNVNEKGNTVLHLAGQDGDLEALDHLKKLTYLKEVVNY